MSFVLVFFTTFYLTKEDVGEFDLILITISLLSPFITFQLTDAALRWLLDNNSKKNSTKVFSTISTILFLSLILFLGGITLYSYYFSMKYIVLLYLLIFFQSYNIFFQQCIRGFGKNKMYVATGLINTFIYVGLAILSLAVFKLKVDGLLYANIIATIVASVLIFVSGKLYRFWNFNSISFEFGKNLLKYSMPLIPNSLSWWAISSANRYIILLYLGAAANGVFAIAYKLPTILLMFVNIFYLAWQEKAIVTYDRADRDEYYTVVFEKYVRLLFSLSILIVAGNKILLSFIVSKEFFEAWQYTPLLLLSIVFSSMAGFYGTGYLSAKKTKGAFFSSVFGGFATVGLSFLLIPKFGLHGASIAICIGYLVLLLIRIFHMKEIFKIDFPIKTFIIFLILFVIVSLLNYGNNYLVIFNIILTLLTLLFFNKDDLKILKTIVSSKFKKYN
jgi:O-antigen/teichoic acid export membrane protein